MICTTLFGRFEEVVAELATTRIRSNFPGPYSREPATGDQYSGHPAEAPKSYSIVGS